MSHHEEHPHESPKKVYFGVPIAFALSFWFVVFLCLKACDGPSNCCDKESCSKECMEKCKAEGKECKDMKEGAKEEKTEATGPEKQPQPVEAREPENKDTKDEGAGDREKNEPTEKH